MQKKRRCFFILWYLIFTVNKDDRVLGFMDIQVGKWGTPVGLFLKFHKIGGGGGGGGHNKVHLDVKK